MTGFTRPGLRALVPALQDLGTVTVVAPAGERSAAAQSLTLRQPIYCDQIAEREYAVEGTPADAVILAFHTLLEQKPDLVVSGINRGGNMGENIYYSGTVGAAMEGAINRVPAIAVSLSGGRGKDWNYGVAADFVRVLAPAGSARWIAEGRDAECKCAARVEGRSAGDAAVLRRSREIC